MPVACADPEAPEPQTVRAASRLSGPYLGQTPPGSEPVIFAPGTVSTGLAERDLAMTPEGDEIYYTAVLGAGFDFSAIFVARLEDGQWTGPEVAEFSGQYKDLEPAISPDGKQLFFLSYRPADGSTEPAEDEDLWVMDRGPEGWGEPRPVGPPVNSDSAEFFPSVTRDGTLYFTRRSEDRSEAIYRSRWVEGSYQEPERLGPEVNSAPTQFNAFIDPDERFIIVCSWGREDSLGGVDYYIVFRDDEDNWTGPINLGEHVNQPEGQEWSPYVTPDGKYLFFMSSRNSLAADAAAKPLDFADFENRHTSPMNGNSDIWWVDAAFLQELGPAP